MATCTSEWLEAPEHGGALHECLHDEGHDDDHECAACGVTWPRTGRD